MFSKIQTIIDQKLNKQEKLNLMNDYNNKKLLEIHNLTLAINKNNLKGIVLDNINLTVPRGKIIGLVGESGCGKTMLGNTIMRLLPEKNIEIISGNVNYYDDENNFIDLLTLNYHKMQNYRSKKISMIFQEPMSSLNPIYTVGYQIFETIQFNQPHLLKSEIYEKVLELLAKVGINNPKHVYSMYPHQLSGGMRQRIIIAIAIANSPSLIIADEPTTALDVTISKQILFLLYNICKINNSSMILITHDLSIVANICDEVYVMYLGQIIEHGNALEVLKNPLHPYTKGLIKSLPEFSNPHQKLNTIDGNVPSIFDNITGCKFKTRCNKATKLCDNLPQPKQFYLNFDIPHTYKCHY